MQGWTVTKRHGVKRIKNPKSLKHTGNLVKKTYSQKMFVNSRLKTN